MKGWLINILGGCCVVMAALFICFPFTMIAIQQKAEKQNTETNLTQHEIRASKCDLKSIQFVGKDSISMKLETIRCNQLHLLEQQDRLIDDFRQEMNNNINKINTWLAYAIGIMGLVGVFIPIVIQFKIRSDEKELTDKNLMEFKEKMEEFDGLAQRNEGRINQGIKDFKEEIAEEIIKVDRQMQEQREDLEKKFQQLDQLYIQEDNKIYHHLQELKKDVSAWLLKCDEEARRHQENLDRRILHFEEICANEDSKINIHIQNQKNELSREMEHWKSNTRTHNEVLQEKLKEIDRKLEEFDRHVVEIELKVRKSMQLQKDEIEEELNKVEREYQLHRLWSRFMSFSCCYEDKALKGLSDRTLLINYIWNKVQETFSDIVTYAQDNRNVDELGRISIVMSLTILNSIILKIKNNKDIKVYRKYDDIESQIKVMLKDLIKSIDNHAVIWSLSDDLLRLNQKILSAPQPA